MSRAASKHPRQNQSQSQSPGAATLSTAFPVPTPARRPASSPLLARYAESVLWLARYMERVENCARLLEVGRSFAHDEQHGRNWRAILRINGDEAAFRARYPETTGDHVARFYLLDGDNPTSIRAAINQVRENARTLRALISTEMWVQINVFHSQLTALTEADIAPQRLSGLCARLRDGVQSHTGVTEGTFYRDQSWSFYWIGRHLERADQMTRLVDITYAALTGSQGTTPVASAAWDALLRAADGYHAYRRVYPHGYSAADVAGFLLLDGGFPRSVGLTLSQMSWHLDNLRGQYRLPGGAAAIERLHDLRGLLAGLSAETLLRQGLSPFLDRMQREMAQLQDDLAAGFYPIAG